MAGSKSRDKGQRFERQVCKAFRDKFGGEWRRTPGGESQRILGDVKPLAWDDFPFVIECKVTNKTFLDAAMTGQGPLFEWWTQAANQVPIEIQKCPLLVCRWDRHEVYAVLDSHGMHKINCWNSSWNVLPLMIIPFPKDEDGRALYLMPLRNFMQYLEDEEARKKESIEVAE